MPLQRTIAVFILTLLFFAVSSLSPGYGDSSFDRAIPSLMQSSQAQASEDEDEEVEFYGSFRYSSRGPFAAPGFFAWALTEMGFVYALLGNFSYNLLDDPSVLVDSPFTRGFDMTMEEANRWINQLGRPHPALHQLHFASELLRSYGESHSSLDLHLEFELEEASGGHLQLKRGRINWSAAHRSSHPVSGSYDNLSGSQSRALNPERDRIEVRFFTGSEPHYYQLIIDIEEPMPIRGSTSFLGMGVPFAFVYNYPFGYANRREMTDPEHFQSMESYFDVLENMIMINYTIRGPHKITIEHPQEKAELTFDESVPGVLEFTTRAKIEPEDLMGALDHLEWTFPEIEGSTRTTEPENALGREVTVRYEGLPETNSGFGEKKITATLEGFRDPPPRKVKFFFPRDGTNNPEGEDPNWFYYWKQTSAGHGQEVFMIYDPNPPPDTLDEDGQMPYGYYLWGHHVPYSMESLQFFICPPAALSGYNQLVLNRFTEGIDNFATTVLHEYQHSEDYNEWWGEHYDDENPDEFFDMMINPSSVDSDGDRVPNDQEEILGLDPDNPFTLRNIYGAPLPDVEVTASRAELQWQIGSADKEDWANPGKQYGGGP